MNILHQMHTLSVLQGFDEYMNLVLDEGEEVHLKTKTRKTLGELLVHLNYLDNYLIHADISAQLSSSKVCLTEPFTHLIFSKFLILSSCKFAQWTCVYHVNISRITISKFWQSCDGKTCDKRWSAELLN